VPIRVPVGQTYVELTAVRVDSNGGHAKQVSMVRHGRENNWLMDE
jgi:hypothetical protein